jgi:putative hemolysin
VPGSFPIHDLSDLKIDLPEGNYTTIAGLILDRLGYLPHAEGVSVDIETRRLEVVEVEGRAITRVRIFPPREAAEHVR